MKIRFSTPRYNPAVMLMLIFSWFRAEAAYDDMQFLLGQERPAQLRFENVLSKGRLLSKPAETKGDFIILKPDEELLLRVDKDSMVRVHSDEEGLTTGMFDVKVSAGTGLYFEKDFISSDSSKDLLLEGEPYPTIVRLKLKPGAEKNVRVALLVSRYEKIPSFVFYPNQINLNAKSSVFFKYGASPTRSVEAKSFTHLEPGKPAEFSIKGPQRVELLTRYIYAPGDNAISSLYAIDIKMDNKHFDTASAIALRDYNNTYHLGGETILLSASSASYINVPSGQHRIELISDMPIVAEVHSLENPGHLLSQNNSFASKVELTQAKLLKQDYNDHASAPRENDLLPSNILKKAVSLGENHQVRSSGLQSYNLLRNLQRERKDDIATRQTRDRVAKAFTWFNDLIPGGPDSPKKVTYDWVINYKLADTIDQWHRTKVLDRQKEHLLNDFIAGYFVEASSGNRLKYTLPERHFDSDLRVMVEQRGIAAPRKIYVKYDNSETKVLTIYGQGEAESRAYHPNYGLIGLDLAEHDSNDLKMGTLGGIFGQNHEAGSLVSAGLATLPLPRKVRNVVLWTEEEPENTIRVALQYHESRSFRMSSAQSAKALEVIANEISPAKFFAETLRFMDHSACNKISPSGEHFIEYLLSNKLIAEEQAVQHRSIILRLYNNLLNINRFLYERYQKFAGGMTGIDQSFIAAKKTAGKKAEQNAEEIEQQKDGYEAVTELSEIIRSGDAEQWGDAHLARAQELKDAGSSGLAEKSLKAIIIGSKDLLLRKQAYQKLLAFYKEREFYYGIEGLASAYLVHLGEEEEVVGDLAEALVLNNNKELAIQLAGLLRNIKPNDAIVYAATKIGADMGGARLGERLENREEKYFWQAQELQTMGRYSEAIKYFKKAGAMGQVWANHLLAALAIRKDLKSVSKEVREQALAKWGQWTMNHPGTLLWESAKSSVHSYHEAASTYSLTDDKRDLVFIATKKGPVSFKIAGPAKVKLALRPLLAREGQVKTENIWVLAGYNGQAHPIRLDNTPGVDVVRLVGRENLRPGIEQIDEFEIPAGSQLISVETQSHDVIVDLFVKRPLLAVTALPPLTPQALSFIKDGSQQERDLGTKAYSVSYQLVKSTPNIKGGHSSASVARLANIDEFPIDLLTENEVPSQAIYNEADKESAIDITNRLLYHYSKTMQKELLVKAGRVCKENAGDYQVDETCGSFNQLSRLARLPTIGKEVRVAQVEEDENWVPENEVFNIRKSLMDINYKENYILADTSASILSFTTEQDVELKIIAEMAELITENPGDATVKLQLDQGNTETVHLTASEKGQEKIFALSKGKHSLRMFLDDPKAETFVKVEIFQKETGASEWVRVSSKVKKEYFVATKQNPIKFQVRAPAWIQVHKLVEGSASEIEDYFVESGMKEITLKAGAKDERALYRIFEKLPENRKIADMQAQPKIGYVKLDEAQVVAPELNRSSGVSINENLPLFDQDRGTWSLGARYGVETSSDTFASGSGSIPKKQKGDVRFLEESITYRYFSELSRTYFKSDLISRQFNHSAPSYGIKAGAEYIPLSWPVTLLVEGKAFSQRFNNANNYSLRGEVGIQNVLHFSRKTYHVATLSAFWNRIDFAGSAAGLSNFPDPEIYTNYDKMRMRGMDASYIINYLPWLDTKLWAGVSLRSNTSYKFYRGDNVDLKAGFDQLITPFVIGLDYSHKRYLKGDGRNNSFNRNTIGGYIKLDHWLPKNNQRIEFIAKIDKIHDSNISKNGQGSLLFKPTKTWVGSAGINWHFGVGRGYRDFKEHETQFRSIQKKSIPSKNEVK